MASAVSFENDGSRVFVRYYGHVKSEDLYKAVQTRFVDPDKFKTFGVLVVDYSDVTELDIDDLDVKRLAEGYRKASQSVDGVIVAAIAPSDLLYGLSRVWESNLEDIKWEHGVFRSYEEANEWIDLKLIVKEGLREARQH